MKAISRQEVAGLREGDIVYVRMEIRKPLGELGTVHCRIANEGRRSHYVPVSPEHILTGPNAGDWFVVAQYDDQAADEKAQTVFAKDPECQQVFVEIAKFAKRISREMVIDLDL